MHYAKAVSPLVTALTVVAFATEAIAATTTKTTTLPSATARATFSCRRFSCRWTGPVPTAARAGSRATWRIRKGTGIVYRYKMTTDDQQKVVFSVGGPVLKQGHLRHDVRGPLLARCRIRAARRAARVLPPRRPGLRVPASQRPSPAG